MGVPVRRSLLKEAGIATSLGVVVAAGVVGIECSGRPERHRRVCKAQTVYHTGRLLWLVPDARIKTESQHEGVLRTEPHDGRANGRGRRRARQRLVWSRRRRWPGGLGG